MCHKYTLSYKCVECGKKYRIFPEKEKICDEAIKKRHTCKTWGAKKTHDIDSGLCAKCMRRTGCEMRPVGETGRDNVTRLVTRMDTTAEARQLGVEGGNVHDMEKLETDSNYGLYN
ncbi:hypothetical protein DL546_002902 [Coniochaeta pulveracea]|uniref:Uncharacterized protein n=1 Tax=Coniochaeta pulveracea TaxID=177199 RepID=A0A420Y600_9PEZI|nr:hypothetical protein DL546_002902 [Coniochaeta pulveracea]